MRKTLSVALAALASAALLAACSLSPPESMAGTRWERASFGQGSRLDFDATTANLTLLMAGADDIDGGSFVYEYEDGSIVFYEPGRADVYSAGSVKGGVMKLEGDGGIWGNFYRK